MKKLVISMLCAAFVFSLQGCKKEAEVKSNTKEVMTFEEIYL